ncbi:MAG: DUF4173 domain-containing protein [Planctomycetaceae bacterium]|nr:DUF4173 domain-containing protein [Planctomycetaceae bacterium]
MGDGTDQGDVTSENQAVQAEIVADANEPAATGERYQSPFPSPPPPSGAEPPKEKLPADELSVTWRELLAVLLMVVLADLAIYRSDGYAGYALFFALSPVLLLFGSPRRVLSGWLLITGLMLLVLAGRLVWCGSGLQIGCGLFVLAAFSMAMAGMRPFVLELIIYASQTFLAGYEGLATYRRTADRLSPIRGPSSWLNYGLPLVALLAFGTIFIVANPDLLAWVNESLRSLATSLRQWIYDLVPDWQEALFWAAVFWLTIGLLRPVAGPMLAKLAASIERPTDEPAGAADAPLYVPFRNTLLTVIGLFAVYLVFEFRTLWFREFPTGFYYSGYAHEGAAWLTVALALATVVLSLIFRGTVLRDARLPRLRRMAWLWSFENLLLAAAVYHRMLIYIHFNGMTWMRTVGFFGMTCVVVGFGLVVWKIVQNRSFAWLLRHHLLALALCVYLFALTPVDALVHRYNVRRIMSGDSAPSVQISVHPISAEGVPVLLPLAECPDEIVREGILAMLADRRDEARRNARANEQKGWTTYQGAERVLLELLDEHQSKWSKYADVQQRRAALARFHDYAYQWY